MKGQRQKPARLKKRKHDQYIKAIRKLASELPEMQGYDHELNMLALFQKQGPDAVKGYIMAIDEVIYKTEQVIKQKQAREN